MDGGVVKWMYGCRLDSHSTFAIIRRYPNSGGETERKSLIMWADFIFTWQSPVWFVIALILVTVAHEAGHWVAARLVGIPVKQIAVGLGPVIGWHRLYSGVKIVWRALPLGAAIGVPGRWKKDGTLRRPIRDDLLVAVGGPAASFLFTALLVAIAMLWSGAPAFSTWLLATALLSTLAALLNLLPLPGLDGGHITLLIASLLGWKLSPQQEIRFHRKGLRLVLLLCMVLLVIQLIMVSSGGEQL
jgi:membrane-associated protease RseP (regulator of RpoE activity)